MKRFLLRLALFSVGTAVICELLFRTAVPAAETPYFAFDQRRGFVVNDTSGPRSGTFTAGRLAEVRTRWHVNDQGWLSRTDYETPQQRTRPAIALIGDSYVEGIHVDPADDLAPRLERDLSGRYAVYSFGTPGAGLAHYAWITPHVVSTYAPSALVYFIVEGDLEESVAELWPNPLAAQYIDDGTHPVIRPPSYEPRPYRRALRASALARYLLINVRLTLQGDGSRLSYGGERAESIRAAARLSLKDIRQAAGDIPVLFVLDAMRDSIYRRPLGDLREDFTHGTVKSLLAATDPRVLDLTLLFQRDFVSRRRTFNYDVNYHWNPYARKLIARAVAERLAPLLPSADR